MFIFDIGIKIILGITAVFFIVIYCLCFAWSDMHRKAERLAIAAVISFLYSFMVFFAGLIVVAVFSLAWEFLPKLF